ncbi:conserved Plasmodium protein, unknown function [Plasmodium relictum]|uniref:SCD domain-containing protein n=1 Tax=Plasmodium relictum TaxID=85471 RepID=A0A1J1HA22_PLARL|nr:conserved Plasmodium protein, unknown function [Plasmodium relictum]CRH01360.1 conserved Plasmodium protein, unknown function [Plasmodium relictum]
MDSKIILRRSSRLIQHNTEQKNISYESTEQLKENDISQRKDKKKKKNVNDIDDHIISTDENDSLDDSDYSESVNVDDDDYDESFKERKKNEVNNKAKDGNKKIVHYSRNNENNDYSNENSPNNKIYKNNNLKNISYIDKLNENIDDEDFEIFKRSKFDRNKRISTANRTNNQTDIKLKKRKSVYVESSNSEDSSESDDEYTNESTRPSKKFKKNDKMKNNKIDAKFHKNFEDFNLYEKIKKNPKNLHEVIEEIYYILFNKEQNEKVKISTFFLNFLAECSGNDTLTWTIDIIDYIDKQIYLYEEISKNKSEELFSSNRLKDISTNEIITPSTAKSNSKITNIDEIIKDENNFEKVCTFKCEKLEQYLTTDLDNDVLIKKKNENNKSYKAFSNFFSDFSFHFDENYIYEILYICIWIFSLSVSKYRKIRFTSSLASFSILLGLCKKINYINNHEKQSRKQLLAEYVREIKNNNSMMTKRGSSIINNRNTKDIDLEEIIHFKNTNNEEINTIIHRNLIISQLIDNINEDRRNLTILNNFLLCTYNILYKNKIKDVFIDIRVITLEYFYNYLDILTAYFTNRKFTKLLIWILYDKDSKVKMCCLNILIYLCNHYNMSTNKNLKIVELLYISKKKLLNLIFDNDYNVRIKTFELILEMSKMQIRKSDLINLKRHTKSINTNNKEVISSDYDDTTDTSCSEVKKNDNLSLVYDCDNNKEPDDTTSILSKREKKIVSNLIWFNNNNKISKIITSLIYESQIKHKIKKNDKKKNNYFDVDQDDINNEIVRYNIIYLTKYLNKNIPTVKNFIHYFDYLANYNENMKLYSVIDKFIIGIREKLDSINNIDIIIELLCEEDTTSYNLCQKKKKNSIKNKNISTKDSSEEERKNDTDDENVKKKKKNKENAKDNDKNYSKSHNLNNDPNKYNMGYDLRKCLLHICESSYKSFQNDINELEKNKNKKNILSSSITDKNIHNMKLNSDTNKIKKMIIYTFHIIKNSKLLIKLYQTNQEHLLLVYKILKIALYECKHIYKNEEKNNIYNFSSTIMEYFRNDIDSNINFFFNNVFIYLKETYEYLFYLLKNFKLPYYSTKYTMNMISLFLSLNESFKNTNKLSSDLFFDLYYTYFDNFLSSFQYYRKKYNTEIEYDEEEEYIANKKNKVIIINDNLLNKDKNVIDSIENDLINNITTLIHLYTLCFNYINNDLSNYSKKNDIKVDRNIKKFIEQDYFKFIVNEKYQLFLKENIYLNEFFDENKMAYYDKHYLQNNSEEDDQIGENEEEENEEGNGGEDEDENEKEDDNNIIKNKKFKKKKNYINNEDENIFKKLNNKINKNENMHYKQNNSHNLYYCSDACVHANIIIHLCFYLIKSKINSIYYYGESLNTPSSRLILLCIDQIYIIYENYIYHLCRKRYFFNYIHDFFLKNCLKENENLDRSNVIDNTITEKDTNEKNDINAENKKRNEEEKENKDNQTKEEEKKNKNNNINLEDLKNLHNINSKKKSILRNLFLELNYLYQNVITLRDDFNDLLIFLIRVSNNTILKYGTFLNLMNVAQLENVILFSLDDLKRYKTLELFLNKSDEEDDIKDLKKIAEKYLDVNEEINKYKNVARYVYKEDNVLFNFVTELFKNVENINNDNYNFVNSFLSIDISVFFPINTYTYISDMCKIYNKDELSENKKILEMQYMHMTLIIAQFILNCNNINIFNSCLGVLLLIHLNVKNKGLSSIALNFHNKLKKYNIDIFYEVLLCALIGLYTAYINNALEEKDLLLFSTSIASRLGVKIIEKQKLPLCKFIHSCVNCALNLKNQNSFLKYILPYAQKLNLSDYQLNYLKKQIISLIQSYNISNNTSVKYENSIFEHMILIICKKRKLTDEYKDSNYENSYMNLNESIHMNISKNISNMNKNSEEVTIKTRKSVIEMNKNIENSEEINNVEEQQINLHQNKKNAQNNKNYTEGKGQNTNENDDILHGNNDNIKNNRNIYKVKKEITNDEVEDNDIEHIYNDINNDNKKKQDEKDKKESIVIDEENENKKDLSEYEKTPSNSTLSNFISLNENDDNVNLIDEMKYDNNTIESNNKSIYIINSSPKPIRSKKNTKLRLITKKELDTNINDGLNKSLNVYTKNSIDNSLNSSLNNVSDKDNDEISIISEKKDKINYFVDNDDDSNSDIIPGMSPIKVKKRKKSELSTPISYADDLMNF